jgi:hypothetical protein
MPSLPRLLIGLLLPLALVLGSILLIPASAGHFLGISFKSWCLFACAPATSLLLALCTRGLRSEEPRP